MGNNIFSVDKKVFLVTGGTRGIGLAISLLLARNGAKVYANFVRNVENAGTLERLAKDENLDLTLIRADLTNHKGLDVLIGSLNEIEIVHGLIHCAATGVHKKSAELSDRHFDWTMGLNAKAFLNLVNLLRPKFSSGSTILAISSPGANRAVPFYTIIGASKAALESIVRHLAAELGPAGIRANVLTPGSVMTDAWKAMPEMEQRMKKTIERTPLGRLVTTEEIAATVQFLCSDASSAITGQSIMVDGGAGIVE
jgi:enoyl-[acyl-carrier protein] reductase III